MPETKPILKVEGLGVDFATQRGRVSVVRDAALSIGRGQMHALVGESGSGKSVTARAIMGLLPRTAIRSAASVIRLGDDDIADCTERQLRGLRGRRMAMIFQEPMSSLNPVYSVAQQLIEAIRVHQPMTKAAAMERATELLDEVGLPTPALKLRQYPHELSGGQRQRVMIAMALSNRPDLLIADEPTTALDVIVQAQVLKLIGDLQQRYTMGVLLITHDLTVVRRYADSVSVMERGAIVEAGPARTIFAAPRHSYTQMLLAAEPTEIAAPSATPDRRVLLCASALTVAFPARASGWRKTKEPDLVAVDAASIDIGRGDAVGIVGESGSGKTTFGLALLRLIDARSGSISYDGVAIEAYDRRAMRPLRARMQVVLQDPFASLNPRLSVGQLVGEGLIVNAIGSGRADRVRRVQAALRDAGMPNDILDRFPHEFSGGQRQRLSIARAIAVEPEFLLLDEPTSALDLSVQAQILALLQRLQATRGLTYLFISHDLKVVRALCSRLIVMKAGRIVETGATSDILKHPQSDYTRALVRAALEGAV